MKRHKKIGRSGGVTIPSDVRKEFGYTAGAAVDINIENGDLVISKHTPACLFCDSNKDVNKFFGKDVCRSCIELMAKEVGYSGNSN